MKWENRIGRVHPEGVGEVISGAAHAQPESAKLDLVRERQAQVNKGTQTERSERSPILDKGTQTVGQVHDEVQLWGESSHRRFQAYLKHLPQNLLDKVPRAATKDETAQASESETVKPSTLDKDTQTMTSEELDQSTVERFTEMRKEMITPRARTHPDQNAARFEQHMQSSRTKETFERVAREADQVQKRTRRSQSLPPNFRESETRMRNAETQTPTRDAQNRPRKFTEKYSDRMRKQQSIKEKKVFIKEKRAIRDKMLEDHENDKKVTFLDYHARIVQEYTRELPDKVKEWAHHGATMNKSWEDDIDIEEVTVSAQEVQDYMHKHTDGMKYQISRMAEDQVKVFGRPFFAASTKQDKMQQLHEFNGAEYKKEEQELRELNDRLGRLNLPRAKL